MPMTQQTTSTAMGSTRSMTRALGVVDLLIQHGIGVGTGEEVVVLNGVALELGHGAEIHLHQDQTQHHYDGEQGIEVIGDGPDEQGQTLAVLRKARDGAAQEEMGAMMHTGAAVASMI